MSKFYYVVFFETKFQSMEEAVEQAREVMVAHRTRASEFRERGQLLMAGAFVPDGSGSLETMGVFATREAAEEFAGGDPFLLAGMVRGWRLRVWNDMFA